MSDESQRATDRDTIREWAEERGGHPARVEGTGDGDGDGDTSHFSKFVSR